MLLHANYAMVYKTVMNRLSAKGERNGADPDPQVSVSVMQRWPAPDRFEHSVQECKCHI